MDMLRATFRSLRHRNFRFFIIGQGISLVGTWMQQLAMSWLVYRLTGSALLLGTVSFLNQLPALLFSPVAGVLADRYNKRKMLLAVQTTAMLQAFALAALVLSGKVQIWHIVGLGMLLGLVNAFDMPVRQSFVVEMLGGKEDLNNAIALNSSIVNGARIIGPALAGIAVAAIGEGLCFLINGLSFIAVLIALYKMEIPSKTASRQHGNIFTELKAGYKYLVSTPPLAHIVMMMGTVSVFGMAYQVLMPVYVKEILHGGPQTFGLLMGVAGMGALCAAIWLASRENSAGLLRLIPFAAATFGGAIVLLSFMQSVVPAAIIITVIGMAMMAQIAASNSLLQTISADHMRGRVMAYYTMSFFGLAPLGSLYSGTVAQWLGVQNSFLLGGLLCIGGSAIFAWRISVLRLDKIPEKADGTSPSLSRQ